MYTSITTEQTGKGMRRDSLILAASVRSGSPSGSKFTTASAPASTSTSPQRGLRERFLQVHRSGDRQAARGLRGTGGAAFAATFLDRKVRQAKRGKTLGEISIPMHARARAADYTKGA